MNVTFLSYSDDTGLIRSVTGYIRMRTNDLYLVLSKDFGVYYVNHVEKKTQYEAPTCRSLQIAKRNSQTTPPIPESQDSQFMGKYYSYQILSFKNPSDLGSKKYISFKNGGQIELSQKIHIVMVPIKEFRNFFTFIQKRLEKNEIN